MRYYKIAKLYKNSRDVFIIGEEKYSHNQNAHIANGNHQDGKQCPQPHVPIKLLCRENLNERAPLPFKVKRTHVK